MNRYLKKQKPNSKQAIFEPHPFADERMRSAKALIKILLHEPGLSEQHRREFLRLVLWKITEAGGRSKHKTRFKSEAAISTNNKRNLQHEHVFPRKDMANELLAHPDAVDKILERAVGCTVTKEEHARLNKLKGFYGWERYKQAGIIVIDTKTGQVFCPDPATSAG